MRQATGSGGNPGGDALTADAAEHVRLPAVGHFVRLKLRLLGNTMRGGPQRVGLFILGIIGGAFLALGGFTGLAAGTAAGNAQARLITVAFVGSVVTLGWVLMPLLFFGIDETLDPARFALLPVPFRTLIIGLLAAACVGIAPVATFLAMLGPAVGGAVRGGPAVMLVAFAGAAIGLLLCVAASRAVTSALAAMLRSRRVRDLAVILFAVLASSIAPIQLTLAALLSGNDLHAAAGVARVLSWTPLAAPYAATLDAIEGHWLLVLARLAIGLGTVALLLWWWSMTLESAMIGVTAAGTSRAPASATDGVVAPLFPVALRRLPGTPFGAIVARECRYWWRDPRRRAGIVSLAMSSVVVPAILVLPIVSGGSAQRGAGMPFPVAISFAGIFVALALSNQFGYDGTAYAMHLLTGVPGRVELLARSAALAVVGVPVMVTVSVGLGVAADKVAQIPAGIGAVLAAFGASLGIASLMSVLGPFAMPETSNPFAMGAGGSSSRGLLAIVGMIAAGAATGPILVVHAFLPERWRSLILVVGIAWGLGGALLGGYIGGDVLDRRGPEVLMAVTPRR